MHVTVSLLSVLLPCVTIGTSSRHEKLQPKASSTQPSVLLAATCPGKEKHVYPTTAEAYLLPLAPAPHMPTPKNEAKLSLPSRANEFTADNLRAC